MVVWLVTGL